LCPIVTIVVLYFISYSVLLLCPIVFLYFVSNCVFLLCPIVTIVVLYFISYCVLLCSLVVNNFLNFNGKINIQVRWLQ